MKADGCLNIQFEGRCWFAQFEGSQANVSPGLPQAEPVSRCQLLSRVGGAGTIGQHRQRFGLSVGSLSITGARFCH
jgi:hypothetical protein